MKTDYDMAAPGIACRADMVGAKVYEVTFRDRSRPLRVLAHDQAHADLVAQFCAVDLYRQGILREFVCCDCPTCLRQEAADLEDQARVLRELADR